VFVYVSVSVDIPRLGDLGPLARPENYLERRSASTSPEGISGRSHEGGVQLVCRADSDWVGGGTCLSGLA
jgi:hypothetical protein